MISSHMKASWATNPVLSTVFFVKITCFRRFFLYIYCLTQNFVVIVRGESWNPASYKTKHCENKPLKVAIQRQMQILCHIVLLSLRLKIAFSESAIGQGIKSATIKWPELTSIWYVLIVSFEYICK